MIDLYFLAILLWRVILYIFFREIKPRGVHNIPKKNTPVIFVAAPHHNQFLDALLLSSEVIRASNRKLSFLTADKSMNRFFIGEMARAMEAIPVKRAADDAKPGIGTIYMKSGQPDTKVYGLDTKFTSQLEPKMSISLSNSLGGATAEVLEVISDTELSLKKPLNKDIAVNALLSVGDSHPQQAIKYKVLPFIDQEQMYKSVYDKLKSGGCIGIFPEGGSHDRSDLLPLKAGVTVMALGAMAANPDLQVQIVPVGLSYFHAHKFRSRAVIEFGAPRAVPRDLVNLFNQGGQDKREACKDLLEIIYDGLKSVTVQAPDYETLMVIQAGRRLFKTPGQHLTLGQVVELNRRLIAGYLQYKDDPKIQKIRTRILKYNRMLQDLGIRDHQVEAATRKSWKTLGLLLYRIELLTIWGLLALPGAVLHIPVFFIAKIISHKKAKEALAASTVKIKARDVVGSWKVLVSLALIPLLYTIYVILATYVARTYGEELGLSEFVIKWSPIWALLSLPYLGISALKFGEVGMDVYKSLRPLFVSLLPWNEKELMKVKVMRQDLSNELADIIDEYGPKQMEDFEKMKVLPSDVSQPKVEQSQSPFQWLDEMLFGWSTTKRSTDSQPDSRTDDVGSKEQVNKPPTNVLEEGDFDTVVSFLDTSYHPYNAANIERVRKDEEKAHLERELEVSINNSNESKNRLDKLRNKPTNPDNREHRSEHINFWSDLEKSANDKGKAKDEFPDMQLQRPSARWYDSQDDRAHARDAEPQRKRFRNDKDGDTKLKDTQDPLNIMKEATHELDKRSKVSKPIRNSHKMSKRERREEKERQRARQL
ncbi:hypothetical protein E3Q13_02064 [Wallemia mellicola]|nr:hypothetical protein E3Q13_02064 [Wallemia mellicola]